MSFHVASKTLTILEEFFKCLLKLTQRDDIPIFRIMPIFLLDVLALLASNADEKRLFSEAELIKTKLRSTMTFEPTAEMIDPTQKPVLE